MMMPSDKLTNEVLFLESDYTDEMSQHVIENDIKRKTGRLDYKFIREPSQPKK